MKLKVLLVALILCGCAQEAVVRKEAPEPLDPQRPIKADARARAKAHADLGLLYFQQGQMNVALEEARIAIAADADYAPGHRLQALVYMYLGDAQAARASFASAARLAANDPELNNDYGWFLCTQGQEREGIERLMSAARNPLYATPTKPYTNAGLCARRLKDDAAAERFFRNAVQADAGNAQPFYHLADIAYARGDLADARRYVGEVNRLIEPTAESLWLALRIERKLGDRQAEARLATQLRRKFAGTREHQALVEGRYE